MLRGGLRVGKTDQMIHASTFAFPTSGKWYWEVYSKSSNGSNYYMPYSGGVCNTTFFIMNKMLEVMQEMACFKNLDFLT